jgi:hypothetical protein
MVSPVPRLLLGSSAVILAFGGFMHANAFERALTALAASNLEAFYSKSFKALWLIDSATLLILASIFGLAAIRPGALSRGAIVLLACIPAATALFLYMFIGTFVPAHMLLLAAVAAFSGAFVARVSSNAASS